MHHVVEFKVQKQMHVACSCISCSSQEKMRGTATEHLCLQVTKQMTNVDMSLMSFLELLHNFKLDLKAEDRASFTV